MPACKEMMDLKTLGEDLVDASLDLLLLLLLLLLLWFSDSGNKCSSCMHKRELVGGGVYE
jgi:hypothetical protein